MRLQSKLNIVATGVLLNGLIALLSLTSAPALASTCSGKVVCDHQQVCAAGQGPAFSYCSSIKDPGCHTVSAICTTTTCDGVYKQLICGYSPN